MDRSLKIVCSHRGKWDWLPITSFPCTFGRLQNLTSERKKPRLAQHPRWHFTKSGVAVLAQSPIRDKLCFSPNNLAWVRLFAKSNGLEGDFVNSFGVSVLISLTQLAWMAFKCRAFLQEFGFFSFFAGELSPNSVGLAKIFCQLSWHKLPLV